MLPIVLAFIFTTKSLSNKLAKVYSCSRSQDFIISLFAQVRGCVHPLNIPTGVQLQHQHPNLLLEGQHIQEGAPVYAWID